MSTLDIPMSGPLYVMTAVWMSCSPSIQVSCRCFLRFVVAYGGLVLVIVSVPSGAVVSIGSIATLTS